MGQLRPEPAILSAMGLLGRLLGPTPLLCATTLLATVASPSVLATLVGYGARPLAGQRTVREVAAPHQCHATAGRTAFLAARGPFPARPLYARTSQNSTAAATAIANATPPARTQ